MILFYSILFYILILQKQVWKFANTSDKIKKYSLD